MQLTAHTSSSWPLNVREVMPTGIKGGIRREMSSSIAFRCNSETPVDISVILTCASAAADGYGLMSHLWVGNNIIVRFYNNNSL